jgi:hypothetical protein
MPLMLRHRHLIPLLVAVLVIQSLVAVLPHTHGPTVDGQAWQTSSHIDETHHCLACSAHAPVVEPTAGFGGAAGSTITIPFSAEGGSSDVFSTLSTASPRGPPRIV